MQKIEEIIKTNDKYKLSVFSGEAITRLEENIVEKNNKLFLKCLVRKKDIQAKPEEIIRQLMLDKLVNDYGYSDKLLRVEYPISLGSNRKSADIVILNPADLTIEYCIVEVKQIKNKKDGKEQLRSYVNATGAPLAIWTNGEIIDYYERLDPNYFEPLDDIPKANETIDDVKNEFFTFLELMQQDRLFHEKKSLKNLIEEMEDEVLANAGVDVFEEVFKLIFTKLYDEMESADDRQSIETQLKTLRKQSPDTATQNLLNNIDTEGFRKLEFRSRGDALDTKKVISDLFTNAKDKWPGIFSKGDSIRITDANHL